MKIIHHIMQILVDLAVKNLMINVANSIGQQIRERRKDLKINQAKLAQLSGIGLNSLSRLESGKGNPTLESLQKIAEVLGFELKFVIKGT